MIERIRGAIGRATGTGTSVGPEARARVRVGIGDDAAICERPRYPLLLCSDAMVEGTHFRLDWSTPEDIGHKALASTLSDIAAMNGHPLYALVSLGLRADLPADFVERLYIGLSRLAYRFEVDVVGGDLTRTSHEIFIDVSVAGEAAHPVTRSGARPGDLLAVSGTVGTSRAGLFALQNGLGEVFPELLKAHLRPVPRFDVVATLSTPGLITAMIDISDGLASETHHLARASNCGFEIDADRVPLHSAARKLAEESGQDALAWAWSGGEDYQLLVALDPALWATEIKRRAELETLLTVIGKAQTAELGVRCRTPDGRIEPVADKGWNHFS